MKNFKLLSIILMVAGLVGCGSPSITGREGYKQYGEQIEDTKIIHNIRTAFRSNPIIPDRLIYLAVDRGIVQLSGFVHNNQEADLALLTAMNVQGVKDVINSLVVLSSNEYANRRAMAESRNTKR